MNPEDNSPMAEMFQVLIGIMLEGAFEEGFQFAKEHPDADPRLAAIQWNKQREEKLAADRMLRDLPY